MPVEEGCFRFLELELAAMATSGLGLLGWRGFFGDFCTQRCVLAGKSERGDGGKGRGIGGEVGPIR